MKKVVFALVAALVFLPAISFAQQQDEWAVFQKHQGEERAAFNKQMKDERDAFLSSHPDVAARLEAQRKAAQERAQQRRQTLPMRNKMQPAATVAPMPVQGK